MAEKIIIDSDPGQDDALAILLALASPEIEVLGIVAAAGNVPLSLTERNIRKICELAGRSDIKVFAGCNQPMTGPLVTAEHVHGATGLDGAELPEPTMPLQEMHGVDFIVETLMDEPAGSVTLCMLGPLTNLGKALTKAPEIAGRIKKIVLMGGGCFEGGNITPAAEFNIYVDPPAAAVVFGSGVPIVMMPLDVTHKTLTTRARVNAIRDIGTPLAYAVVGWLDYFERFDVAKYGSEGGPLHDPNVIAYLLKPELYCGRQCNVEIETESELTKGMTVADWWGVSGRPKNALFIGDVDADGFYALLTERLSWLGREELARQPMLRLV
ncbi:purine nucleosidase [Neorhizobium sp. R1-B]|uniref:nucleoside hydrolase n=1 Tax=Neorhizobium TaxID=1525371 RepID=UPI000CF8B52D|nr:MULTISPECIES: nucleoside hydrolase [Neorhizobium]TCV73631.1 purine nucleosidase [Neorhizobium sp. S3-V5DH]TDX85633.1 purine nucleosidase [Neorhizobium sp. R1-B]